MEKSFAHILRDKEQNPIAEQTVEQHCHMAAKYASKALEPALLPASGYLAGLIHDLGKYSPQYQDYLERSSRGEKVKRGSVNHTFAGVRLLLTRYHRQGRESFEDITAEILALAAGGHHGWFDVIDDNKKNGFLHRMTKEGIDYSTAVAKYFQCCADAKELDRRFQAAVDEMSPILERVCEMTELADNEISDRYYQETAFYAGLLARLILSGVIEGDRRDTAEFMQDAQFPKSRTGAELERLWGEALIRVEDKLSQFSQDSAINRARGAISDQCKAAAQQPGGVFRLNVPTGGGKTLSALRYALAHGKKYRKQRIIFTSPLLSILDQNADVIRGYLQDDSIILEHHSNLMEPESNSQELDERELYMETWEAPVIITTLVQLLNTLFSGKTAAIRRFHSLCGSIIVIDEVQTVPSKMLTLFSLAVNFLAEICGATVVLCSATQPCMERIDHPLHTPIRDLVPYDEALWAPFQRTNIQKVGGNGMSSQEIADFALCQLTERDSVLIVCNKKGEAEEIFHELETADASIYLLSAAMCPAHRRNTLSALQASLGQKGGKTICVSTQVIEAGVDISFACVIRLAAGMDSVVQAAGRCNRHGEKGLRAPVYVVQYQNEKLANLPDIAAGQAASLSLFTEFALHPEQYRTLDSDGSIQFYYQALYRRAHKGQFDYTLPNQPYTLFSLLAGNKTIQRSYPFYFRQAFRRAGSLFTVFEENTRDVLVPYGEGSRLIADLCSERAKYDPAYLKKSLEDAKPYTISLYDYQLKQLAQEGGLIPLAGESALALNGHYHEKTGFSINTDLDFKEE